VARSELHLQPVEWEGQTVYRVDHETRTNSFADAFYKVRNSVQSWFDLDYTRSLRYENVQREGKHDRDVLVTFDWDEMTAQYHNRKEGSSREPIAIEPGTWDPLGIVYYVRCLDLEEGDDLSIPSTNGKEFFHTLLEVTGPRERKFKLGRLPAYRIDPDIKDLGGVFEKSENASLVFYYSADEYQIPLRMESEVVVGKFWAELVRYERGGKIVFER